MNKNDILIKREKEPLEEIAWHLSPQGILTNALFRNIWHIQIILHNMRDLLRIVDPPRMSNNVDEYKKKRDNAIPKQTKIYYHNKIKSIFDSAKSSLHNITDEDAAYYGIDKAYVKEILIEKRKEYEVDTYRYKIINEL